MVGTCVLSKLSGDEWVGMPVVFFAVLQTLAIPQGETMCETPQAKAQEIRGYIRLPAHETLQPYRIPMHMLAPLLASALAGKCSLMYPEVTK